MGSDVKIGLDTTDAIKALNELNNTVSGTADSISKNFKSLTAAGLIAAAAIETFQSVSRFIKSATDAASEQEDAINRLNVALKINGNFTEDTSKNLQGFAETLQRSSKFADDVILNNIALLQSLAPLSEKGLNVASQAAIDLASALRIDLETAFELVAKAANGNIGAFSRYGIEIKKGQTDAETFANTLDVLNSKFGGSAQSELNTFSGGLAKLKNTFGDLLEEVGNVVIKNQAVIASFGLVVSAVESITSGLKQVNEGFSSTGKSVTDLARQYNESRAEFEITNEQFAKNAGIYDQVIERAAQLRQEQALLAKSLPDFASATSATDEFTASLTQASSSMNSVASATRSTSLFLKDAKKDAIDFAAQIKSLESSLKNAGLNSLEILKKERTERLKLIDDALKAEQISATKAAELRKKAQIDFFTREKQEIDKRLKAEKEAQEKLNEARKKALKQQKDDIEAFTALLQGKQRNGQGNASAVADSDKLILSVTAGFAAVSKGAQGALEVIKTGVTTILSFFGPIGTAVGELLGPVIDALAQGPEAAKKLVTEFFQSFQQIVNNIIEALPELIVTIIEQALAHVQSVLENLPDVVTRFLEKLPEFIIRILDAIITFVTRLQSQIPTIVIRFVGALIQTLPKIAVEFVNALVKEAPRFITELIKSLPNAAVGAVTGVGDIFSDIFGFAEGGRIPNDPRFKNDGAIIRADAGEQILSSDLSAKLEQFLKTGGNGSQNVSINLNVGEAELAKVMLNLNRNGFRVV